MPLRQGIAERVALLAQIEPLEHRPRAAAVQTKRTQYTNGPISKSRSPHSSASSLWLRADGLQLALLDELRLLAAQPNVSEALKKGVAKAADPEAEYRAAMAKLDKRIDNIKWQQELGQVPDAEYMERVGKVNVEKQALRARLDEKRKAFRPDEWDEKFAAIVAVTVAQRTQLDPAALLPKSRPYATGKGRHALGQEAGRHRHAELSPELVLAAGLGLVPGHHGEEEAAEVEFSLWAERLPDLLDRIEVDVSEKRPTVVLVPKPEWVPYLRQKLPGNASISFFRAKASSRVWKV